MIYYFPIARVSFDSTTFNYSLVAQKLLCSRAWSTRTPERIQGRGFRHRGWLLPWGPAPLPRGAPDQQLPRNPPYKSALFHFSSPWNTCWRQECPGQTAGCSLPHLREPAAVWGAAVGAAHPRGAPQTCTSPTAASVAVWGQGQLILASTAWHRGAECPGNSSASPVQRAAPSPLAHSSPYQLSWVTAWCCCLCQSKVQHCIIN